MKKRMIIVLGIMTLMLAFTACGTEQPAETVANNGNITEEETMDNSLNTSVEEDSKENTEKKEDKKETSKEKEKKNSEELVDGMHPEFKEAMDCYEEFFDEYCEFMKKYAETSDPTSLLADYTDYMAKYADYMKKLEKLGNDDLNDAEQKYYAETTVRINEKLLDVAAQ